MALPTTREALKQFCLRKLGSPNVAIDVPDIQLEDRIDEAFRIFQKNHLDATEEVYYKHKITATTLSLNGVVSGEAPSRGDIITGDTSEATANVWDYDSSGPSIRIINYVADSAFSDGETITISSGGTATLAASSAVTLGDIDNLYVTIPDTILSVNSMVYGGSNLTSGLLDIRYHIGIEAVQSALNSNLIGYKLTRQHIATIDFLFNQAPTLNFNRLSNRLFIDWDWEEDVQPDKYLVFKTLQPVDPSVFSEVYGDEFLIELLTAMIKKQWGENLKKFSNVPLPGAATLNGQEIYDEGKTELEAALEKLEKKYRRAQGIFIG